MYYDYIQISKINDFLFCPRSLYFHSVYENFESGTYKARPQIKGKMKHKAIDTQKYSSKKRYIQGMEVFSHKHGLIGKIDVYDRDTKTLIEKKAKIKDVYDGHRFQLFAEQLAMEEMGYTVDHLTLYSMEDNKKYTVVMTDDLQKQFHATLEDIRSFNITNSAMMENLDKCRNCIYRELCRTNI